MHFNYKTSYKATISIIGASEIDKKTEILTTELGRLLAKNSYAVACGGLTIGIIPFKEKTAANRFVDIVIPVPFSQARNIIVVLSGDACVAIAGKAGTLSEICFAWIYEKPLIALSSVEGWSSKLANQKLDDRRSDIIYGAKTPQMVIEKLNELFKDIDKNE